MGSLDALLKYCSTGTTEGELAILNEVFITPAQLQDVLAIPEGSPRVVVGPKGIGKTAMIHRIENAAKARKIPALVLRPDDLDLSAIGDARDIATIKRVAYQCLVVAVAVHLGRSLSGLLDGDAARLRNEALQIGKTEPDFVQRVLGLLSSIAKPVTNIDFEQISKDLSPRRDRSDIAASIHSFLSSSRTMAFLLLDDTDQISAPEESDHLNRIWGLLLAMRKFASESPQTRCIISLRAEVWARMIRNNMGQRDQIDHIRPLIVDVRATEDHLHAVLDRRIHLASKSIGLTGPSLRHFFESDVRLPMSHGELRPWSTFLVKSSRDRPRDLIQLVNSLAIHARSHGRSTINSDDAEAVMHDYSRQRAEYLGNEVGPDCVSFFDVIRSFAHLPWELDFETLRQHLETLPSRFGVVLRGRSLKPDQDAVIPMLQLLHETGFINPRVPDLARTKGYRHVTFADDAHFVGPARWNALQSASWEIHPTFRTFLADDRANSGQHRALR